LFNILARVFFTFTQRLAMANISAVIITKNEERNIARCIESLKIIADEVLIVDSGSTDKTIEIAEKLGAKVIRTEWKGYSATKNYGNNQAEFNFILSIDADEVVSDQLSKSIVGVKSNLTVGSSFSFNRLTNYCGSWIKHCGWYPDTKMRLWNREGGKWVGDIHEQIVFNNTVQIEKLKGDLFHYSYYTITDHYAQADKFTTLTAKDAYLKGKRSNFIKMLTAPLAKFVKAYFIQLGFLDGAAGFQVCRISAYATYMKYSKLKKLQEGREL
jgi:glycosyltransferase involved in cell wall biosynthesis